MVFRSGAFLWEKGVLRDLGTLGGRSSNAFGINERGQVVGESDTGRTDNDGSPVRHAFLWHDGRMTDLGIPSSAHAINDRGQIVGLTTEGAFLWEKGRVTRLGTRRRRSCVATRYWHAFLWQKGRTVDLRIPPADRDSAASAINNRGQVVGTRLGVFHRVFLWEDGRRTKIGIIRAAGPPQPLLLNERGQIVGPSGTNLHAFVWESGRTTDLGTLGGQWSTATAVNENNQIVGSSYTTVQADVRGTTVAIDAQHAVLWILKQG